jgi:hypothetical protein
MVGERCWMLANEAVGDPARSFRLDGSGSMVPARSLWGRIGRYQVDRSANGVAVDLQPVESVGPFK